MQPTIVVVYVVQNGKYLLIRRSGAFLPGNWQMVAGKVEPNETYVAGAVRELKEETGLQASRLYSADHVETFFIPTINKLFHAPVFVAFIDESQEVKLSPTEHDAHQWLSFEEALLRLEFSGQRESLKHIDDQFVKKTPKELFLIKQENYV